MSSLANISHPDTPLVLIIAWGNPQRSDDGAGVVLAQSLVPRLEAGGCRTRLRCVHQLVPELALDMADEAVDAVVFVDTELSAQHSVRDQQIRIRSLHDTFNENALTHALFPETLLAYARTLYHHSPAGWLVTIPGVEFGYGSELSAVVQALLANLDAVSEHLLLRLLTATD